MRSASLRVAVAAAVVVGVSACGGSDESADSASEAVMAQVQAICDGRALAFADRGEFPVADFDPESPGARGLPRVGDYFAAGLDEQQQSIAELKGIPATVEEREQLDALTEAWKAEYENARVQVDAARAADVDAFVATLDDAAAAKEASAEAVSALGVPDCARG